MQKNRNNAVNQNGFFWVVCALSLLGSAVIVFCTAKGLFGGSDSVGYLVSARNLLKGIGIGYYYPDGKFHSPTLHPLIYPVVLSLAGLFTNDIIQAAKALDIVFFGLTIFFIGYLILRFSKQPWLSIIACILLGIFPATITLYSSAMSEALFMLLTILGEFFLLMYINKGRIRWFILTVIFIGLLPVTRFVGIAMVMSASISLLFFAQGNWITRLKKAIFLGLLAVIPLFLWLIYLIAKSEISLTGTGSLFNLTSLIKQFNYFRVATVSNIWAWLPFQPNEMYVDYRQHLILLGLAALSSIGLTSFWCETHPKGFALLNR